MGQLDEAALNDSDDFEFALVPRAFDIANVHTTLPSAQWAVIECFLGTGHLPDTTIVEPEINWPYSRNIYFDFGKTDRIIVLNGAGLIQQHTYQSPYIVEITPPSRTNYHALMRNRGYSEAGTNIIDKNGDTVTLPDHVPTGALPVNEGRLKFGNTATVMAFNIRNASVPLPLGYGTYVDSNGPVGDFFIYERPKDLLFISDLIQNEQELRTLVEEVFFAQAKLHLNGYVHNQLHTGNFALGFERRNFPPLSLFIGDFETLVDIQQYPNLGRGIPISADQRLAIHKQTLLGDISNLYKTLDSESPLYVAMIHDFALTLGRIQQKLISPQRQLDENQIGPLLLRGYLAYIAGSITDDQRLEKLCTKHPIQIAFHHVLKDNARHIVKTFQ